jgi:hypothetical protein
MIEIGLKTSLISLLYNNRFFDMFQWLYKSGQGDRSICRVVKGK